MLIKEKSPSLRNLLITIAALIITAIISITICLILPMPDKFKTMITFSLIGIVSGWRLRDMIAHGQDIQTANFYHCVRNMKNGNLVLAYAPIIMEQARRNAHKFVGATHKTASGKEEGFHIEEYLKFFDIFDDLILMIKCEADRCNDHEVLGIREMIEFAQYEKEYAEILPPPLFEKLHKRLLIPA